MNKTFECPICNEIYNENKRNKTITCANCNHFNCNHCQKNYKQLNCMSCKTNYPLPEYIQFVGQTYYKNTIIQSQINQLLIDEKKLIPDTQLLLEWLQGVNRQNQEFYKGHYIENPIQTTRPIINEPLKNGLVQCKKENCRGYLEHDLLNNSLKCMVCKSNYCLKCNELMNLSDDAKNHECDQTIIDTLKLIHTDCKKCPNCDTLIHRTMGCDHMKCTYCGINFSWSTRRINPNNTNSHYDQSQLIKNFKKEPKLDNNQCAPFDITIDTIPIDAFLIQLSPTIRKILYTNNHFIRKYFLKEYDLNDLIREYHIRNDNNRLKYIQQEISEDIWGNLVYKSICYYQYQRLLRDFFLLYFEYIADYQSYLYQHINALNKNRIFAKHNWEIHEIELLNFLFMWNKSVIELYRDFSKYYYITGKGKAFPLIQIPNQYNHEMTVVLSFHGENDLSYYEQLYSGTYNDLKISNIDAKEKKNIEKLAKKFITYEDNNNSNHLIQLHHYQQEHYNQIQTKLNQYQYAFDLSRMGLGKSFIAMKYWQENNYDDIYIFCPANCRCKWIQLLKQYHINGYVLSYNELAGVKNQQPVHGLLIRQDILLSNEQVTLNNNIHEVDRSNRLNRENNDEINGDTNTSSNIYQCEFYVSPKLNQYKQSNKKIFLLFDEFQHIKNEQSNATKAARTIIKFLLKDTLYSNLDKPICNNNHNNNHNHEQIPNQQNAILFASGTPFDKVEQFITFLRNLGIQESDKLFQYNIGLGTNEKIGYDEILTYSKHVYRQYNKYDDYNRCEYQELNDLLLKAEKANCYAKAIKHIEKIFIRIILKEFSSHMTYTAPLSNTININNSLTIFNTYCKLYGENYVIYKNAIQSALQIIDNNELSTKMKHIHITKTLHLLETSKIQLFCKQALDTYYQSPMNKIVIILNYSYAIDEMNRIFQELQITDYGVINGEVAFSKRHEMIQTFQEPNDKLRILIFNLKVINGGIDLDDKNGNYPRYVFISPTFSFIDLSQAVYRFLRGSDTLSLPIIKLLYGHDSFDQSNKEQHILNILNKKSKLLNQINSSGLTFINEFIEEEE